MIMPSQEFGKFEAAHARSSATKLLPCADAGAIHGFLIAYEPARQGVAGDALARSRSHFDRQVALTHGQLASPFLALAETVAGGLVFVSYP